MRLSRILLGLVLVVALFVATWLRAPLGDAQVAHHPMQSSLIEPSQPPELLRSSLLRGDSKGVNQAPVVSSAPERPPPTALMLTSTSDTFAAINLAGGPSRLEAADVPTSARTPTRSLRGVVLLPDGTPAAGAFVIVSAGVWEGHLTGDSGATTSSQGTFLIATMSREASVVVAMNRGHWSAPLRIEAGDTEATCELRLMTAGRLRGQTRVDQRGDKAALSLHHGTFDYEVVTSADGQYDVELPAGTWTVGASRRYERGIGAPTLFDVTLSPGETVRRDIDLVSGVDVALRAIQPPGATTRITSYWLLETEAVPATPAELKALLAALPPEAVREQLHGGDDLTSFAQFNDEKPGMRVACAHASQTLDDARAFQCEPVELLESEPVHEVALTLRRP